MNYDKIQDILEHVKAQEKLFSHNKELFNIYEGDLLTYIEQDLQEQFTQKAFKRIRHRLAPINVLRRITDKLSKIYQQNPIRIVEGGTEQDAVLVNWYEQEMGINQKLNIGNEFFNLFKNTLIQPYLDPRTKKVGLRSIPSHLFTVYSDDPVNPTKPTAVCLLVGSYLLGGSRKKVYHLYTDDEFLIINEDGELLKDKMIALENPEGINPYGQIPFVYVNRSMNCLVPIPDTDTLKMTKIIPILISDLNYAVMYQAFSIVYGINVEDKNLEMNPSAFWSLKSDPTVQQKPEVGVIKPQVDIAQVLQLIQSEMVFWLETRGIKAGSIGNIDGQNLASGLSKIIDEVDTSEERRKQVDFFVNAEAEFWDLLLQKMHPYWVSKGMIENRAIFSSTAKVVTKFQEQVPMTRRGELVTALKEEVDARFTSRERAIKMLNPEMTEAQIEELLEEIEEERPEIEMPEESASVPVEIEETNEDE